MKIVILGGYGFVGQNVVEEVKKSGYEAIPLSRRNGLDLTDYNLTQKYFKEIKPDVIVNLAALVGSLNFVTEKAAEVVDSNMRMLLNVYKGIIETKRACILINPIANCGFPGDINLYREEDFWSGEVHNSVLSYGSTRRMIDVLSKCYNIQYSLKTINFFVPNMYGPFESTDPNKAHALDALISKFLKAKLENHSTVEIWGTGKAVREWLYVKDFARVLVQTINNINENNINEPINIGQKYGLSIRELVNIIIRKIEYQGEIFWNTKMSDGALVKVMDDKKFKKYFPKFSFTPLERGIEETINYYKSIYPY